MNLKWPWRRSGAHPTERATRAAPQRSAPAIDVSIPRECIYKRFDKDPGPCPRCGGPLRRQYASYLVATRRGRQLTDSFFTGNDMGWFCANCPTVVLNPEDLMDVLSHGLPHWDTGTELAVLGILDLDAIPEDKRHLPLGEDDNPVPLVQFINVLDEAVPKWPARRSGTVVGKKTAPRRKKSKSRKRRR